MSASPIDHPQRNGAEVPAARTFGVDATVASEHGARVTIARRDEAVDASGAMPVGVLALAADHALGGAIAPALADDEVMITSHMHLELVRPILASTASLVAHGRLVDKHGPHAFTRGRAETEDGELLAVMSARFAILDLSSRAGGQVSSDRSEHVAAPTTASVGAASDLQATLPAAPVDRLLRLTITASEPGSVRAAVRPSGRLGNERGGLHGGVGVLVCERALDLAVHTIAARPMRPVELRAVFLRPVAADGVPLECSASVEYAGRSVVTARARLSTPLGKDAIVLDAIYAID